MTARILQICLSLIFLLLGSWCLFFPGMVIELTFRPELAVATEQARFTMGCFGAQAVLTGTIIWTARFSACDCSRASAMKRKNMGVEAEIICA